MMLIFLNADVRGGGLKIRTRGKGDEKWAKICGRPLLMAPKLSRLAFKLSFNEIDNIAEGYELLGYARTTNLFGQ